jgi:hypothetical protein
MTLALTARLGTLAPGKSAGRARRLCRRASPKTFRRRPAMRRSSPPAGLVRARLKQEFEFERLTWPLDE